MKNHRKIAILSACIFAVLSIGLYFFQNREFKGFSSTQNPSAKMLSETGNSVAVKGENSDFDKQKIIASHGKISLHFEPNLGQTDERIKFTARGSGYSLFLTESEAVLALEKIRKNGMNKRSSGCRLTGPTPRRNPLGWI